MMNYQEDFVQVQLRGVADTAPGESAFETVRYDQFVGWLLKPDTLMMTELHIAIGLAGEVAELAEAWYGLAPLGVKASIPEELGDIEFYFEAWRNKFGMVQNDSTMPNLYVAGSDIAIFLPVVAGEFLDWVKRKYIYGKQQDAESLQVIYNKFQYGLTLLYGNSTALNRQRILQQNATKLQDRYVKLAYSNEAALGRADKAKD